MAYTSNRAHLEGPVRGLSAFSHDVSECFHCFAVRSPPVPGAQLIRIAVGVVGAVNLDLFPVLLDAGKNKIIKPFKRRVASSTERRVFPPPPPPRGRLWRNYSAQRNLLLLFYVDACTRVNL